MPVKVLSKCEAFHRAFIVEFMPSNGITYRMIVNKAMGYAIEADKKGYFKADISNHERGILWDEAIKAIRSEYTEENEFSLDNKNFNSDLVYGKSQTYTRGKGMQPHLL